MSAYFNIFDKREATSNVFKYLELKNLIYSGIC